MIQRQFHTLILSLISFIEFAGECVTPQQKSNFHMVCGGHGAPVYSWYKDGIPLNSSNYLVEEEGRIVVVTNETRISSGLYTCNASGVIRQWYLPVQSSRSTDIKGAVRERRWERGRREWVRREEGKEMHMGRHTVLVVWSVSCICIMYCPLYNPCPIIQLELLVVIAWDFMHIITNHLEARCMDVDIVSVVLYRHWDILYNMKQSTCVMTPQTILQFFLSFLCANICRKQHCADWWKSKWCVCEPLWQWHDNARHNSAL